MTQQERIVDGIIADYLETKFSGVKEKLSKTSKYFKRGAKASILGTDRKMYELIKTLEEKNSECDYLTYFDELVNAYREYVEVADVEREDFGEVMTPITLVEEMLDTLPNDVWNNPNLKWLDPCAGVGTFSSIVVQRLMKGLEDFEKNPIKRYRHIIEEMIYVCELQPKNMFIFQCVFDKDDTNELNTYCGSFLDENFDKHMTDVWGVEKFDIVVANPPYLRKLNLKFLNKSTYISNKTLFVHPSSWLIDDKKVNNDFNNCRIIHKDLLEKVILFNGNPIFSIRLNIPCAITYTNNNKTTTGINVIDKINNISITYNDIEEINKFSNLSEYTGIKQKIKNQPTLSSRYNINDGKFFINMGRIRGSVFLKNILESRIYQNDFYTTITKDTIVEKEITKPVYFSFNTEVEAGNFLTYLKTNFSRFCLSISKNSTDLNKIEFSKIPYLDFTQEWTDEKLYQEFNLTQEEINFINTHIPKFY
jgi:site-specific DNA-methyltransferase (adenine-specific)